MANRSYLDNPQVTDPTGLRFWGKKPDGGSPTGFIDVWISFSDLISSTLSAIATVASNLALLVARVIILENTISKRVDLNKNASYDFTLNDTEHAINIFYIRWVSGSPSVKIGTTANGDDLVESTALSNSDSIKSFTLNYPFTGLQEIYVTISGGTINLATVYTKNIFNS